MKLRTKPTTISAIVAAALAGTVALPAGAQSNPDVDALREEVRKLREELNELKRKPPAAKPGDASADERIEQLEIKSKDAVVGGDIPGSFRLPGTETSMRIYGYAEAHAIHDFRGTAPDDNFTNLSQQPLDNSGSPKGKTKFTAETSRIGIETATPTSYGPFKVKIETDFYAFSNEDGNRNRLRLRHAYGEYAGFLVGQTWSTFMDVDDLPETIDFNGPVGAPFSRRTMVRYTWGDAKAGYKFTFALEDPEDQNGGGSQEEQMPQLVLRYDHSFSWGAINVRGLAHEKRSLVPSDNGTVSHTKRGYGVGVGGNYKLTDKDLLMGQITKVDGDIDQLYGANGYAIDDEGNITFDKNWGLVAGWARAFNERLRGNLVYGMNRGKTAGVFDNRDLREVFVNMIYSPIKNVELGAEYIYGWRQNFDGDKGTLSRIDLMGRYTF